MGDIANNDKEIGIGVALSVIVFIIVSVLITGIYIGQKYFWNKYETPIRLDLELDRINEKLKAMPESPELLVEKGWIYYQRSQLDEAHKHYMMALTIDPDNIGALYNLGLLNFHKKQYLEAEKQFIKIEKLYPRHLNNLMILGELYVVTKKADKAIEKLEKLITIKSSWTQVYFLLGQAYELKGLSQKAKYSYLEALRFDPQFTLAKNRLAELGGEKDEATNVSEKAKKNKI